MTGLGFTGHVGLKAVSIALAMLLWLVVAGEQTVERSFRIPLEFSNLPEQMEILGDPPGEVDVRVKGSAGLVTSVGPADLSAIIDLEGGRTGRRLFPLTGAQVRAPFGLDVVQVNPSTVAVTLEASSSKVVPVVPSVDGEPAAGFVVGTVAAEPATVELIGPASALEGVGEAVTEPVSVAGASATVEEEVTVGPPNSLVRLKGAVRARVSVGIVNAPVEWAVAGVPVRVVGGDGLPPEPLMVTLHLRGPRERAASSPADFEATVSVAGLAGGSFLLPVRVVAPERVGVMRVDPPEVSVRVK